MSFKNLCIFGGTSEGRILAQKLKDTKNITLCTATDYGAAVLKDLDDISVVKGRMDSKQMMDFFALHDFDCIIDATHPYAQEATINISKAAKTKNIPLIRIIRENDETVENAVYFDSNAQAAAFLKNTQGNILVTTGAGGISMYDDILSERLFVRILPCVSSLKACESAGIKQSNIIASQGPFSYDTNFTLMKEKNIKYLVTKSSGNAGGFNEKIRAALALNIVPVIIGRPDDNKGYTISRALKKLGYIHNDKRRAYVIGIGPGNANHLTREALEHINTSDALFGAEPVLSLINTGRQVFCEYLPDKILKILDQHPEITDFSVLVRGDTGLFSASSLIARDFEHANFSNAVDRGIQLSFIPGISSLSYFASKLKISYDDVKTVSLHGKNENIARIIDRNRSCFVLCGGKNSPDKICRHLLDYGFKDLRCRIGERLSYPDERIISDTLENISLMSFDDLCIMYLENPSPYLKRTSGLPDECFIRGNVPMTKSPVRALTLLKLSLSEDSIVWDIGAGTGSVSIECALHAEKGHVYAIEKSDEGVSLIEKNVRKFHTDNVSIVKGTAPEILSDLEVPTHVFIGGSSGNLSKILDKVFQINRHLIAVINTITLESQNEVLRYTENNRYLVYDAVSFGLSMSENAGKYHFMKSLNPVMIFTLRGDN